MSGCRFCGDPAPKIERSGHCANCGGEGPKPPPGGSMELATEVAKQQTVYQLAMAGAAVGAAFGPFGMLAGALAAVRPPQNPPS